ncbi:hypothetical protein CUMW_018950 [Citrus unshiu]|nr:hypothetical protein CUMW_018950 [Citrus unshiu]
MSDADESQILDRETNKFDFSIGEPGFDSRVLTRGKGSTKDMIFKIPYLISHISSIMTLFEGDVILTGSPQGVGPVKAGQKTTAGIAGLLVVRFDNKKRRRPGSA